MAAAFGALDSKRPGVAAGSEQMADIRLASLETAPIFLQVELGAAAMATLGGLIEAPDLNLGSLPMRF